MAESDNGKTTKKRRKPQGPRKVRPLHAILGINKETGKPEVVKASKDAGDLLSVFMGADSEVNEKYSEITPAQIVDASSKAASASDES